MKILVMIDMQNDFLNGTLGNPETAAVLPNVCSKIAEYFVKTNYPLIYTMDTHGKDYLNTQEGKNLPIAHCIDGTDGWDLPKDLKNLIVNSERAENDIICIKKNTFGAKQLPEILLSVEKKMGEKLTEIEFIGVCTDICVISNAMLVKAFFPEVKITVDSKCCAGVTPQSHCNALEAMKMCQINVI